MLDELASFAAHTPFELSGLTTATQQLLAYGFTAEDAHPDAHRRRRRYRRPWDGSAGHRGRHPRARRSERLTRGKVTAEEMLQLTEAGIPAWEYLARAIGTDTAGAMEAVSDGAVDAQTGIERPGARHGAGLRRHDGAAVQDRRRLHVEPLRRHRAAAHGAARLRCVRALRRRALRYRRRRRFLGGVAAPAHGARHRRIVRRARRGDGGHGGLHKDVARLAGAAAAGRRSGSGGGRRSRCSAPPSRPWARP